MRAGMATRRGPHHETRRDCVDNVRLEIRHLGNDSRCECQGQRKRWIEGEGDTAGREGAEGRQGRGNNRCCKIQKRSCIAFESAIQQWDLALQPTETCHSTSCSSCVSLYRKVDESQHAIIKRQHDASRNISLFQGLRRGYRPVFTSSSFPCSHTKNFPCVVRCAFLEHACQLTLTMVQPQPHSIPSAHLCAL